MKQNVNGCPGTRNRLLKHFLGRVTCICPSISDTTSNLTRIWASKNRQWIFISRSENIQWCGVEIKYVRLNSFIFPQARFIFPQALNTYKLNDSTRQIMIWWLSMVACLGKTCFISSSCLTINGIVKFAALIKK